MIFCQLYVFIVREDDRLHLQQPLKSLEYSSFVLSSIWSLDVFHIAHILRPFCISPQLKVRDVMLLNFISALTPLLLAVTTYFVIELQARCCSWRCWMPFHRCFALVRNWSATDSLVHAYASLYMHVHKRSLRPCTVHLFCNCDEPAFLSRSLTVLPCSPLFNQNIQRKA